MIDFNKVPSPCFLMDESLLVRNLKILKSIQENTGIKIILALKGFAMFSTFDLVSQYLQGTTASSLNEARLGHEEFNGEVHAYSPAYPDQEFNQLIQHCSHITFNSLTQWDKFKSAINSADKKISCGLRINPEYSEVDTELYDPAAPGSRLGIPADKLKKLPEGIEGLHIHTLFESNSDVLRRTVKVTMEKFGHLFPDIKWLNLGGGHALTKKDYDIEGLYQLVNILRSKYNIDIILEPGSAVAWQAGYLVSTILDIVHFGGKSTAILDVSFAAHMPDCIEMPYKPRILSAHEPSVQDQYVYALGGLSCLAGDVMGNYAFDRPLQPGDKIVFDDMMHYTMVKTTMFNGVNHPSIGIWKNQDIQIIRDFTYQDFKNRLS